MPKSKVRKKKRSEDTLSRRLRQYKRKANKLTQLAAAENKEEA